MIKPILHVPTDIAVALFMDISIYGNIQPETRELIESFIISEVPVMYKQYEDEEYNAMSQAKSNL